MNPKQKSIIVLSILIISSLACSLFSGGDGDVTKPETATEQDAGIPEEESESSTPQYEPGYEPGWRIFSNANFVNGLAFHDGILWAATEGGVVAWDVANDQATKYTTLDGMGHLSTYDVVVCPMPNPTVVVATETGLSLFDLASATWSTTTITPDDSYVATSKISKLFCDEANGRLLIGYSGLGILDIASGGWQRYLDDDGLAWNGVDGITVVGQDVWITGYKGISVISSQGIQIYDESTGMPAETTEAIAVDSDGTVWVGSSNGLLHVQPGGNTELYGSDTTDNCPSEILKGMSFAADNTLWFITSGNTVYQFDPAKKTCVYNTKGEYVSYATDIVTGDAGEVYYSSHGGGIWVYNGTDWRNLLVPGDQLAENFVKAIAEDKDGMLWVATDEGTHRFAIDKSESAWELMEAADSSGPSAWYWFQGIYPAPSGKIWFAHNYRRVSTYDGSNWSSYEEEDGIIGTPNAIAFDNNEIPYIGTTEGLVILDGESPVVLTEADGLPSKIVRSLCADGDVMWVGTTEGLARLQNGSIEIVLDENSDGLPNDNISVIVKDMDGTLLLGTPEGLARFDGEQVVTLLEPQSISGIFGARITAISGISVSPDGSIWVGTYAGVYHGDGQNWEHFSTADGLPANNVTTVFVDSTGVVWVGAGFTNSGGGVARFIPGESTGSVPPPPGTDNNDSTEAGQSEAGSGASNESVVYDENTGLPLYHDAEQVYSTESVVNYWSNTDFNSLREFYLVEMPTIGWLLDVDENGNCLDDDRCMGWHGDYNDPETQTFFFLKGEKGYITMNLIPEGNQVNIILGVNEPAE